MSISEKLGEHVGEWIAVIDDKIIAHGENFKDVYEKARKEFPDREPFIMKVPKEAVMLL